MGGPSPSRPSTTIDAAAAASCQADSSDSSRASPKRKAAAYASPAPVGSTARAYAMPTRRVRSRAWIGEPRSPRVTTTLPTCCRSRSTRLSPPEPSTSSSLPDALRGYGRRTGRRDAAGTASQRTLRDGAAGGTAPPPTSGRIPDPRRLCTISRAPSDRWPRIRPPAPRTDRRQTEVPKHRTPPSAVPPPFPCR